MSAPNLPVRWQLSPSRLNRFWIVLLLILLIALPFRLVDLSKLPAGLYWDEMDLGYQAYSLLQTGRDYYAHPFPLFPLSFADARTPISIYSAVPFISALGLTDQATRLPSVVWGSTGIIALVLFASFLFKSLPKALLAGLVFSLTPWHVHYSRIAFEPVSQLALTLVAFALFLRGITKPRFLYLSALFFGLTVYTYSTSKLFTPLLVVGLVWLFRSALTHLSRRTLIRTFIIFLLTLLPFIADSLFGLNGERFSQLSIFTDPTLRTETNSTRAFSLISAVGELSVGSAPRLVDRLLFSAPQRLTQSFLSNYLSSFSLEFLFLKGDSQLRHSPGLNWLGQLLLVDCLPLLLGIIWVFRRSSPRSHLLLFWLLLAPLPAALTRDGFAHASRLMLLLPPLVILVTTGIINLFHRPFVKGFLYATLAILAVFHTYGYYFTLYRLESAPAFSWGLTHLVDLGLSQSGQYDRVFIDAQNDYALMAYLYSQKYPPRQLQRSHPLKTVTYGDNFQGLQFDKLVLLYPRTRVWTDAHIPGNNLILAAFSQPQLVDYRDKLGTLVYPDQSPAFYIFSRHN